jgi:hypothetical protein
MKGQTKRGGDSHTGQARIRDHMEVLINIVQYSLKLVSPLTLFDYFPNPNAKTLYTLLGIDLEYYYYSKITFIVPYDL